MLLTQLQETITKKVKTKDELQKLIDASHCSGLIAVSHDEAVINGSSATLNGIITAGKLPFKVTQQGHVNLLKVALPTIQTFAGLSDLTVEILNVESVREKGNAPHNVTMPPPVPLKLTTLEGMPKVTRSLSIVNATKLKTLKGINVADDVVIELSNCDSLTSLDGLSYAKMLKLYGTLPELILKGFPHGIDQLDIRYFKPTKGLPWLVLIPKSTRIIWPTDNGSYNSVPTLPGDPQEPGFGKLASKLIDMQARGGTRADLFEIQQDLIEAGFEKFAEL